MTAPVKLRYKLARGLAAIAVVATLTTLGWEGYRMALDQPFRSVAFAGDVDRLRPADLEAFARSVQAAEHPTLESVREAARRVPWVREASVRRQFPDGVEITFQAYQAFARWNDRELVSAEGDVFSADDARELPRLRGPEGSGSLMAHEFPAMVEALAALGSPVAELRLSARGAWEVLLASGLALELGRGDWKARTQRFVTAWPGLSDEARASRHADLRYPNGFALRRTTEITPPRKK
jgi:cell division protein FtsQ